MSEDIRRIISGKMRDLKDPRIHGGDMLTIVRCDVAGDGSFCKVYVSSFEGYEKAKEAVKGFESATGFLKREISNVLKLKKCPELKFIADNSIEHSAKINKLLKEVLPEEEKEEKEVFQDWDKTASETVEVSKETEEEDTKEAPAEEETEAETETEEAAADEAEEKTEEAEASEDAKSEE